MKELILKKVIELNAPAMKVWEALTNPTMTKQYMFGCEVISDWQPGKPIVWRGTDDDTESIYLQGELLIIQSGKLMQFTTFDPNAGLEDIPSNYLTAAFQLDDLHDNTILSITHGDFAGIEDSEKRYNETLAGWNIAMAGLKALVENSR